MTIFRFKSFALAALLMLNVPAFGQAARSGWTMLYSDSEELHKLLYVQKGQIDGDVYFFCRTGEGWIFLIYDVPEKRSGTYRPILKSGNAIEQPSFYTEFNEVEQKFYFEAAIPANSSLFQEMSKGKTFQVDQWSYLVATPVDQKTIGNFATVCGAKG